LVRLNFGQKNFLPLIVKLNPREFMEYRTQPGRRTRANAECGGRTAVGTAIAVSTPRAGHAGANKAAAFAQGGDRWQHAERDGLEAFVRKRQFNVGAEVLVRSLDDGAGHVWAQQRSESYKRYMSVTSIEKATAFEYRVAESGIDCTRAKRVIDLIESGTEDALFDHVGRRVSTPYGLLKDCRQHRRRVIVANKRTRWVVAAFLMSTAPCALSASEAREIVVIGDQQVNVAPLRLPTVRRIAIAENGASAPAANDVQTTCAKFGVDARDVQHYLRLAQVVSEHDYLHTLDWSPCYASGTVVFANGLQGVWGIQQLRAGSLKLNDGRELYLFCPQCKSRAFPRP
jgi:hypothetical protein